jgi:hypothetical protein
VTVFLTSPVLGQDKGTAYTGPLESWLLHEGYARADADSLTDVITVTPTAAKVTGSAAAVNIVTGGNLVLATKDGVRTTVALAAADTPAAAATKIDTALAGLADAAIVSTKLEITSIATGPTAYVFVESGTGTVLANLGLAVDQVAYGGDGRPAGASNTGAQADVVGNDLTDSDNREAPYFPSTPDRHTTIANDGTHLTQTKLAAPGFDFDAAGVDAEAPSNLVVDSENLVDLNPNALPLAGGEVHVTGTNLENITAVSVGGTAGTIVEAESDRNAGVLVFTAPAKAAGSYDVVFTDASGNATVTGGLTYAA